MNADVPWGPGLPSGADPGYAIMSQSSFFEPSVLYAAPQLSFGTLDIQGPTLTIADVPSAQSGQLNYWPLVGLGAAAIASLILLH